MSLAEWRGGEAEALTGPPEFTPGVLLHGRCRDFDQINLPVPWKGDKNSTYLVGLLRALHRLIHIKS